MGKTAMMIAAGLISLVISASLEAAPAEFQVGLAFSPGLPRGEFREELGRTVWGGTLLFAYRPGMSPFLIGTSLGFGAYNSDRWSTWLGITDPDVLVDVRTTNALLTWYLFLRLQPVRGILRPYLDVFAGWHVLSTDTGIGHGDFSGNNSSDAAFAYGAGGGVQLPIIRFLHPGGRIAWAMELDLGLRYAKGGRADYLVETEKLGAYDFRNSRTDLLTLSAGLSFIF